MGKILCGSEAKINRLAPGRGFGEAQDTLVWDEVIRLLANPSLIRDEIDRRLVALRTEQPVTAQRESLVKTLTRIRGATARLVEAYQEELLSREELRARMPLLRQREATTVAQLTALEVELTDAETYVALAESLEGFLAKLHQAAHTLAIADRQRVVRLVLKDVRVGPDTLVLGHSIPVPGNHPDPGYLLCGRRHRPSSWARRVSGLLVTHPGAKAPRRVSRRCGAQWAGSR